MVRGCPTSDYGVPEDLWAEGGKEVFEILCTWGGGVGGSTHTYYASAYDTIKNGLIEATLLTGEVMFFNPRYIVHYAKRYAYIKKDVAYIVNPNQLRR